MSQKREKQIRRIARNFYKLYYKGWKTAEPPRWRFFRYFKWKRREPVYELVEKQIRRTSERK